MRDQGVQATVKMNCVSFFSPASHSHFCHCEVTLSYKPTGACAQLSILYPTHSSITFLRSASISTHSIKRQPGWETRMYTHGENMLAWSGVDEHRHTKVQLVNRLHLNHVLLRCFPPTKASSLNFFQYKDTLDILCLCMSLCQERGILTKKCKIHSKWDVRIKLYHPNTLS